MKVQIQDRDALSSLTTSNLRSYLQSRGWADAGQWGERATLHVKEYGGRDWEILIPLRDTIADYAEVMAEAVAVLATVEDRSQLDVFYDLANPESKIALRDGFKWDATMASVWRVGADKGDYTDHFVTGGYAAAGWIPGTDLTEVTEMKEFKRLIQEENPDAAPGKVAAAAGAICKFMVNIKPGDYIITPTKEHTLQRYGRVESSVYYCPEPDDGCPFPHRRKVDWAAEPVNIADFSQPLHNALKFGVLALFKVHHHEEFLTVIGPHRKMLDKLLKIDETEFEMLVSTALKHKGWRIAK